MEAAIRYPPIASSTKSTCLHQFTERVMLWTIFVVLLVLWALGLVSGYTIGGFIHVLLLLAVIVVVVRVIQGRPPV
jgi:hypothetical protein